MKLQTLKGFRDFLATEAIRRRLVVEKIQEIFERYGFDPLETPALEYAETLLGKYGSEADKLLYTFKDNGGRLVGLRYDQTVPLSRVVAQYPDLPRPFKRYQIQPVWRAENTQKGRFREFLQCDIDTIGTNSPQADAEIIAATIEAVRALGISDSKMLINDRTILDDLGLSKKEIITLDKLAKIGKEGVLSEWQKLGRENAEELFNKVQQTQPTSRLKTIFESLEALGFTRDKDFTFTPSLARGLEYYTSTIFELQSEKYAGGSLAGGGRYDKLIGSFSGIDTPAVGIAFGFDRILDALNEQGLLPDIKTRTQILVTTFSKELDVSAFAITSKFRDSGIATDIAFADIKLDKQLKYADKKGIPYVVIQGPDEEKRGVVKLKNMKTQSQEELTVEQVIDKLKEN